MEQNSNHRTFFLAPMGQDVGLTSMSLGLVRALQRDGINVGFIKPISQPEQGAGQVDLSTYFARTLCHIDPARTDRLRACRGTGAVRSSVGAARGPRQCRRDGAAPMHDVVIVEGLIPDADLQIASLLNAEMARSLSANIIPVISGRASRMPRIWPRASPWPNGNSPTTDTSRSPA